MRYEVDWDALETALAKPEVGLLLWCNPHNPVGRVWTRDEMVRVAKTCVKHDVVLVSDEVWRELILDEDKTPFTGAGSLLKEVDGLRERLVVMTSPSKTLTRAGATSPWRAFRIKPCVCTSRVRVRIRLRSPLSGTPRSWRRTRIRRARSGVNVSLPTSREQGPHPRDALERRQRARAHDVDPSRGVVSHVAQLRTSRRRCRALAV